MYAHRLATDPDEYAAALLRATGTEVLLVDDGFPPPRRARTGAEWASSRAASRAPVLRIERVAEEARSTAVADARSRRARARRLRRR